MKEILDITLLPKLNAQQFAALPASTRNLLEVRVLAVEVRLCPCHCGHLAWIPDVKRKTHLVRQSKTNPLILRCDCTAAGFGHECAHVIGVRNYIKEAASPQKAI